MSKKLKLQLVFYSLILIVVIAVVVISMVSYMSLNDWDIRCLFTECKPIRVIGGK